MVRSIARPSRDHAIADLASAQDGVVDRAQLVGLGITPAAIDMRVRRGRLHSIHRGVYSVGHRAIGPRGRRRAAVFALGLDATLSDQSAAAEWGALGPRRGRVHVSVPGDGGRLSRPGIAVHRCPTLVPGDVTRCDGLPVTTVARTLIDLAERSRRRDCERAVDGFERLQLFDLGDVRRAIAKSPARRGAIVLAAVLSDHDGHETVTRSELEERFLALCRHHRLEQPRVNAWVALRGGGAEADFLWPQRRLVVELDGFATHGTREAFEDDRRRDRQLRLAGYTVVRFTWRDVTQHPDATVAELHALLRGGRLAS